MVEITMCANASKGNVKGDKKGGQSASSIPIALRGIGCGVVRFDVHVSLQLWISPLVLP